MCRGAGGHAQRRKRKQADRDQRRQSGQQTESALVVRGARRGAGIGRRSGQGRRRLLGRRQASRQRLHDHRVAAFERGADRGGEQLAQLILLPRVECSAHHRHHLHAADRSRLADHLLDTASDRVLDIALGAASARRPGVVHPRVERTAAVAHRLALAHHHTGGLQPGAAGRREDVLGGGADLVHAERHVDAGQRLTGAEAAVEHRRHLAREIGLGVALEVQARAGRFAVRAGCFLARERDAVAVDDGHVRHRHAGNRGRHQALNADHLFRPQGQALAQREGDRGRGLRRGLLE
ncbi:hypothetical protein D3C87_1415640 [compost metagenome]